MGNPIKLALAGLGRAGYKMHLGELKGKENMFEITAVCDLIEERNKEAEKIYGCKSYTCFEEMVEDPDIEVVDIATRSVDHFHQAKTALEAGKTVFLEKPMCLSVKDAEKLVELSVQNGERKLYMRHNRRFEDKFVKVNEIIDSGILGEVYFIKLARSHYGRRRDWQTLSQYGGGQLYNWGPHIIDHALKFCGGDYKSLSSQMKQLIAAGDCDDFIFAHFEGVNGRIVTMEISGATALKVPEYILYGTRGTLYDNGETYTLQYLPENFELPEIKASAITPSDPYEEFSKRGEKLEFVTKEEKWVINPLDQTWKHLYNAVRLGKEYPISNEEALKIVKTTEEIRRQNGY